MTEAFIGAAIKPDISSIDATRLVAGQPAMPQRFQWNKQMYQVMRVIRTWRDTGPCTHGSGERYVRKHWFEVQVDLGSEDRDVLAVRCPSCDSNKLAQVDRADVYARIQGVWPDGELAWTGESEGDWDSQRPASNPRE